MVHYQTNTHLYGTTTKTNNSTLEKAIKCTGLITENHLHWKPLIENVKLKP